MNESSPASGPPKPVVSQQGRRVLVAVVTGEVGDRIQRWREEHDPEQARRIPPHTTLCYFANNVDVEALGQQVGHAFASPVTVQLGTVREFDNPDHTFYVEIGETGALDAARERLYDGTYVDLGGLTRRWTWHVTCLRYGVRGDLNALRHAARELKLSTAWPIDLVELLELRGGRYERIAAWPNLATR